VAYENAPSFQTAAPTTVPYANWGQRVGAYLIDALAVAAVYFVGFIVFYLAAFGVHVYNRWVRMGGTGQSWGKQVLGIKLISEKTGEPIGALMAFVRDICHFVDGVICYVGFLFPIWDAKRQTIADKIMTTVVVDAG
jgi:uncharacterized RDD family membrane protein YckC